MSFHCVEKRKLSIALFFQDQIQVSSVLPLCREKEAQHRSLLPRSNPSVQCPSIVSRTGNSASLSSSKMKSKCSVSFHCVEKRKLSIALFFQDQIQVSSVLPLCREKEAQHRSLLPRSNPSVQCPSIVSRKGSSASLSSSKINSNCPVSFHCVENRKLSIALFFQDEIQVSSVLSLCREKEAQYRSLLPRSNPSVQCPSIVSRKGSSASLSSSKIKSKCPVSFHCVEKRKLSIAFFFQDEIHVSSVLPLSREKEAQHRSLLPRSNPSVQCPSIVSRKGSSSSLSSSKIKSKCPVSFHCVEKRKLSIVLFFQDQIQVSIVLPLCREKEAQHRSLLPRSNPSVQYPSIVSRTGSSVSLSSSKIKSKCPVSFHSVEKRKLSIALFFQYQIQVSSVLPLSREKEAQHRSVLPRSNPSVQCPSIVSRKGSSSSLSSSKIKSKCPVSFHCVEKRKLSIVLFFQDQIQVSSVLPLCREKEAQHRSLLPRSNPSVQCPSIVSRKGSSASLFSSKIKSMCPVSFHCVENRKLSIALFFQDQIQVSSVLPLCRETEAQHRSLLPRSNPSVQFPSIVSIKGSSASLSSSKIKSMCPVSFHCVEKRKISIALFFQDQIQVSSVLPLCREKEAQHRSLLPRSNPSVQCPFIVSRTGSSASLSSSKIKSKCPVSFHCNEKMKLSIALFFQDQIQVSSVLSLCREQEAQHRSLLPRSNPSVQCPSIVSRKGSSASLSSSKIKSKCPVSFHCVEKRKLIIALFFQDQIQVSSVVPLCREKEAQHRSLLPRSNPSVQCRSLLPRSMCPSIVTRNLPLKTYH